MSYISCKNVYLKYENLSVVENLDFKVEAGDYLCIVGENGSGKSTLIKSILGLKETASGHLHFGDGVTAKNIGYLPQQTTAQKDFPASVYEVVLSGCVSKKEGRIFFTKKQKKLAEENMKKLEILDLSSRCYRELSGGQQQRVLLARALCATKKLLILDEPVAGLDPIVTEHLYEIIKEINKSGITVIMVSHDIKAAVEYASHVLHIGQTPLFHGTKHDYEKCDCRFFAQGGCEHD